METGLFEIQAEHLRDHRQTRRLLLHSQGVVHAVFGQADLGHDDSPAKQNHGDTLPASWVESDGLEFARCFLRLANLPNLALDRLSRYEATLWRQAGRILYALDALDRRKPQERRHRSCVDDWRELPTPEDGDC
jgi:hypothetical protein